MSSAIQAQKPFDPFEDDGKSPEISMGDEPEVEEQAELQEPEEEPQPEEPEAEEQAEEVAAEPEVDLERERILKQRTSLKTKFNQVQREKFQALNALERAQQKISELERMHDTAAKAALYSHDRAAQLQMETAKKQKQAAIESGDVQAQIDADVALSHAAQEVKRAEEWRLQSELSQRQAQESQQQYYAPQPSFDANLTQSFVNRHPWVNPNSDEYEPDAAEIVTNYSDQLDNYLHQNNAAHIIGTPAYFNELEAFIYKMSQAVQQQAQQQQQPYYPQQSYQQPRQGQVRMRNPQSHVSGVSYGAASRGGSPTAPTRLTPAQKEMAKSLNISEKDFQKSIEKCRREDKGKPWAR